MHKSIVKFWFKEIKPSQWWKKDEEFDKLIKLRFLKLHNKAKSLELIDWRNTPKGRLAEIIILDQFSRNIYRNTSQAFQNDALALNLSQSAIKNRIERELKEEELLFIYMPFMHSESLRIQKISVKLFETLGLKNNFKYALKHYEVIKKFGRFPHRNNILNRKSTFEEKKFLIKPGSSF